MIDHTLLDIKVVDSVYRKAIGRRPWITVCFDVFSRMVLGFYVSLDPPGNFGTGQCIANTILPKESWLARFKLNFEWPCWGKLVAVHADNAGEFRGKMLKEACKQHGTDLIWRPVLKPRYGAHIERYLGDLADSIHALPGTTFSNPKQRGKYDSEGKACFTLDELEAWLLTEVIEYNSRKHSAFGISPRQRYEDGLLEGVDGFPPVGIPPRITDIEAQNRLRIDLMPFELRTIQQYGVKINKIRYDDEVLHRWTNATAPTNPKQKLKFKFRIDPRDISSISFYDPELRTYFPLPYRDTSLPPMSRWDLKAARKELQLQGVKGADVDERVLAATHEKKLEQLREAEGKTKAARTDHERRRQWDKSSRTKPEKRNLQIPQPDPEYTRVQRFTEDD